MRSLFWKIFLWFWLAMTLVIAATAFVSNAVRNANDGAPPNARLSPRLRAVANTSFAQWAQSRADAWENDTLAANSEDATSDDLDWLLFGDDESAPRAAPQDNLEWWLFSLDRKNLAHQKSSAPSTSKTLSSDVRELVKRARQTNRVVTSRPESLSLQPPDTSAPDAPAPDAPANTSANNPRNASPPSEDDARETILALRTRTARGQNVIFVARLPLQSSTRPPPPDAAARRAFPLAFLFLRGAPLTRTFSLLTMLLTAGLFCWWLARHVTRPITQLRATVDQLSEGNLAARSDPRIVKRADELGDLGRDFNDMAARLETLVGAQKRLIADVSHELRSPLARLNLALELTRRHLPSRDISKNVATNTAATNAAETTSTRDAATTSTTDAATLALNRIEREATRLETIVAQLLTLSRPDAAPLLNDSVEIAPLLQEIVDDVRFEYSMLKIEVRSEPIVIRGSRDLLRGALENIVRNAVRFSPRDRTVFIEARNVEAQNANEQNVDSQNNNAKNADSQNADSQNAGSRVEISVRDEGSGVPQEALSRLFEPFYRVEDARDRQSGGVVLGLAIAQQAVQSHGGNVRAANAPNGGFIVTIELPKL